MKNAVIFLSFLVLFSAAALRAGGIVTGNAPSPEERFAAEELRTHLNAVTGKEWEIFSEGEGAGREKSGIISVGRTSLAEKAGFDRKNYREEEWLIRSIGKDLILAGGDPRGTLYAVYEFLERFCGVRWCDLRTTQIPCRPDWTIPTGTDLRGRPFARVRNMYWVNAVSPDYNLWAVRNRMNGSICKQAKYGFRNEIGSPSFSHTYYNYSEDFPLECFSMNASGIREKSRNQSGPGQLCRSNPLTRRLTAEKLRSYILSDRKRAEKAGEEYPVYYLLFANDNSEICHCRECRALAEKWGESGACLDFVNAVARSVREEFPEVIVGMDAYRSTLETPKGGIRAEPNVMILLAMLGVEFEGANGRDILRPLDVPQNRKYRELLKGWSEICSHLGVWDYWRMFGSPVPAPVSGIGSRGPLMKEYADRKVEYFFIEGEIYPSMTDHFLDLRNWLGARLLREPYADADALTDEFMNGFYGKAAPVMKEYLVYLESRMREEKGCLAMMYPGTWAYLDDAFYRRADSLLKQAETLLSENRLLRENVLQERYLLEESMFLMYGRYPGNPLNLSREALCARAIAGELAFLEKYHGLEYRREREKGTEEKYRGLLSHPELPAEFKEKNVAADFVWADISTLAKTVVADSDAAGGKALRVPVINGVNPETFHQRDFRIGVYAGGPVKKMLLDKTVPKAELPKDEKYHFMYVGKTRIPDPSTVVWVHWSWHIQVQLARLFDPAELETDYDVWVSLKFEGPDYAGSASGKKESNVFLDRVILTRASKE